MDRRASGAMLPCFEREEDGTRGSMAFLGKTVRSGELSIHFKDFFLYEYGLLSTTVSLVQRNTDCCPPLSSRLRGCFPSIGTV